MAFTDLVEDVDRAVQQHLGGVTVVYQPEAGDAVTVTGMFDATYVLLDQGNAGVEQVTPAVWLRLEDLPVHPSEDDPVITVNGTTYRVRERQVDSVDGGSVRLLLHRSGA
jgi:anti-sigma factor ChrR (cupin superfamily)